MIRYTPLKASPAPEVDGLKITVLNPQLLTRLKRKKRNFNISVGDGTEI